MTSRISYSKLRRENVKHRAGIILITWFCFFVHFIAYIISLQNTLPAGDGRTTGEVMKGMLLLAEPSVGSMGWVAVLAGVLLAVSSFGYLHSKTKVDFYQSLPIRRRDIYCLSLTCDLMLFVTPLFIAAALECAAVAAVGYFTGEFAAEMLSAVVCYMGVFAVVYLTMTLAMLMTGHTFVALMGFGVFAVYAPILLKNLYPSLADIFFKTYCLSYGYGWGEAFDYFSPASLTIRLLTDTSRWTWAPHVKWFAAICVWIVVLTLLNGALFRRRPMEAAGRAMVYEKANPVIRILLVIPLAVYVGLILHAVSFEIGEAWLVAGMILGAVLIHGLIECIYRFDIRGLLANKRQMLVSMAAAFVLVGIFWLDITGYDRYLPDREETASVLIDMSSEQIGGRDPGWGSEREGLSGETLADVLEILDEVRDSNDENWEAFRGDHPTGAYYTDITVSYRLKSGRTRQRNYVLDADLCDRLLGRVFGEEQFKRDSYALFTADQNKITSMDVSYPSGYENIKASGEQKAELLRLYLEEFAALDYETAKETQPFGILEITHRLNGEGEDEGTLYATNAVATEYYCLYPSFQKTIAYLRDELKLDIKTSMSETDIARIDIYCYNMAESDISGPDISEPDISGADMAGADIAAEVGREYVIRDPEAIDALKGRLCLSDATGTLGALYQGCTDVDITAVIRTEYGEEQVHVTADTETVKELLKHCE